MNNKKKMFKENTMKNYVYKRKRDVYLRNN